MIRVNNRVSLYARYSSDNQRSESIDAQVRAMKAYCKQHNFVIVNTYIDEAKSATTDRRPAFQQMIADSSNKIFDIVLVHKLDRFSRNRYDSAIYKRELKKNGVKVYSVLENLDDSPESVVLESILEGFGEFYSKNLSREVKKGLLENALKAVHNGGKPPLGYDVNKNDKKLIINEHEAEAVKIIFTLYSQGYGYSHILAVLHEKGYKTKNGKEFQKNSLYSILTNPKYQGTYVFNRCSAKSITGTRNTHLLKDAEDIIYVDGGCPQIVPTEVYENVQKRITEHKHTGGRQNAKENYLLSGKVFCKECGRSMVGNTRYSGRDKTLYITYRCPSKRYCCSNKEINRDYLEKYVIELLEEKILNASSLLYIAKQIESLSSVPPQPDYEAETKLAEINIALKNVADAVAQGLLSEALITRLRELEQQKAELERTSQETDAPSGNVNIDTSLILSNYREVKDSPASPAYKEFICGFISKIEVGRYTVDITLKTGLDICKSLDTTYPVRRQEVYERKKTV